MIAIGFVMFVIGWFSCIAMSRAHPFTWTKSKWSDLWTVMWGAGALMVIIGIAKIMWHLLP